jgi:hypothetical protein
MGERISGQRLFSTKELEFDLLAIAYVRNFLGAGHLDYVISPPTTSRPIIPWTNPVGPFPIRPADLELKDLLSVKWIVHPEVLLNFDWRVHSDVDSSSREGLSGCNDESLWASVIAQDRPYIIT